jgi:hypothetical protein
MVEHVLVTDLPWPEVRATLTALLAPMGFRLACTCLGCGGGGEPAQLVRLDATCPECRQPRKITFSTGNKSNSRKNAGLSTTLWLTLQYQRGRVELAAAIEPPSYSRKELDDLLVYLADAVAGVLVRGGDVRQTLLGWWQLEHVQASRR